jgi:hypothetical protein
VPRLPPPGTARLRGEGSPLTVRRLDPAIVLKEPLDFSLVLGGPLYQLWLGLRASTPGLELLVRRLLAITALAWLPLLVLAAYERIAAGHVVPVRFLYDLDSHARFLVAIPLFLVAEVVVHQRLRPVVWHFRDSGIVTAEVLPAFQAAIARAIRLRNSVIVEVIFAVAVFGFGWMVWRDVMSLPTSTWYAIVDSTGGRLTLAGRWYAHVSIPIFQFLMLRWVYRLLIWFFFLWRVSRLDLRLVPAHPDRAGGLGFLGAVPNAFAPLILAFAIVLSANAGMKILFLGATLQSFQYVIAAFVILQLILVLGPLCVFAPVLLTLKRRARLEYGALGTRYARAFQDKWIAGGARSDEPLLGSGDIQSLADLANSYQVVRDIQAVPFGRDAIIQLGVAALLPFAPLALTVIPAEEIVKKLLGMLL